MGRFARMQMEKELQTTDARYRERKGVLSILGQRFIQKSWKNKANYISEDVVCCKRQQRELPLQEHK